MKHILTGLVILVMLFGLNHTYAETNAAFTEQSTVGEVVSDPAFGDFGRLLFPVDRTVTEDMTLKEVSSSSVYVWYNYIDASRTVSVVNELRERSLAGEQIFYNIYSDAEIAADPSKADTGLFFFRGNPGERYAIVNAGGGFMYVGAMHDSFPHAQELAKRGYNAFVMIYRPDDPYNDLARAIAFISDHADELGVAREGYSLWGGSAGARMAAALGNADNLYYLAGRKDIPQAGAVIMQYTGYSEVSPVDAPTYACVGTREGIASWKGMQNRLNRLKSLGIPTEFHPYEGLPTVSASERALSRKVGSTTRLLSGKHRWREDKHGKEDTVDRGQSPQGWQFGHPLRRADQRLEGGRPSHRKAVFAKA